MAKFDYIKAQATAQRLIARFGQRSPIVRVNTSYNEVEGTSTVEGYYLTTGDVVSLPASALGGTIQGFDNRFREDLKQGKIKAFYIAAKDLTFKPKGGDKIFFEGDSWDIAGATSLNPAGVHILSTIGCRQGDKKHLGPTLEAIAKATEGIDIAPPVTSEGNIISQIVSRIEALEGKGLIVNNW